MKKAGNTWIPDSDEYFGRYFEAGDVFELGNLQTGLKYVKKWDSAVDGGAHVGSWTRYLAGKFKKVMAFEPNLENFECLVKNIKDAGLRYWPQHWDEIKVYPKPYALGERTEMGYGLDGGANSGCWHLRPGSGTIGVEALDEYGLDELDYYKLDVEGFEYYALKGAEKTIAMCRPVIQIEEKTLSHKYDCPTARSLLEGWGYKEVDRAGRDVIFTKD
jgi:hypothetical protein